MSSSKSMKETCLDKGHRVGNFHNYYEFNPADNRLKIMENCGIFRYLVNDVFISSEDDEQIREKKRMKRDKAVKAVKAEEERKPQTDNSAKRNKRKLLYCDLGCNEGDLTLALGNAIMAETCDPMISLYCLGLDIDTELIKRAKSKNKQQHVYSYASQEDDDEDEDPSSMEAQVRYIEEAEFDACDFNNKDELKDPSSMEAQVRYIEEAEFDACDFNNKDELLLKSKTYLARFDVERFRLISVFSTTMWIHIHGGDKGLVDFFQRICSMTDYLLLEPQPSKCYRSVNVRLRKLWRPEVDVSTERLELRENIEYEVDRILKDFGFDKVDVDVDANVDVSHKADINEHAYTQKKDETSRTAWKRKLQLYRRRET
eukprot:CAMPEP_0194126606 /NCGR_PEP_ID=MMETSP0150-20130528/60082_1 /TAXON_ID=122233 /ORGANISM="Chaetoceros debilis, Strain MM31A-1" /LENGTH=371 /DNA_ID=CAMNT_0038820479 /DNA_START=66 /DNA_END=1182 /DNA_ORIENTATION=-